MFVKNQEVLLLNPKGIPTAFGIVTLSNNAYFMVSFADWRFNNPSGIPIGSEYIEEPDRIVPATPELKDVWQVVSARRLLRDTDWNKLPDDKVLAIVKILSDIR